MTLLFCFALCFVFSFGLLVCCLRLGYLLACCFGVVVLIVCSDIAWVGLLCVYLLV